MHFSPTFLHEPRFVSSVDGVSPEMPVEEMSSAECGCDQTHDGGAQPVSALLGVNSPTE